MAAFWAVGGVLVGKRWPKLAASYWTPLNASRVKMAEALGLHS